MRTIEAFYDAESQMYTVTGISVYDAHYLIWGGKESDIILAEQRLREALVDAEDNQMTNEEYAKLFGDKFP